MKIYLIAVLAVIAVACGYRTIAAKNSMQLCNHPYALCTSATCLPQPDGKAVCFCDVIEEGPSMATMPCNKLKPTWDDSGTRVLYSTFSLNQFQQGKLGMKCPSGTPWTWCLNKRCLADPTNPKAALCICDLMQTGEWMTLGGDCDTSTCQTGYWSGASMGDFNDGNVFMSHSLGLPDSQVNWCPTE